MQVRLDEENWLYLIEQCQLDRMLIVHDGVFRSKRDEIALGDGADETRREEMDLSMFKPAIKKTRRRPLRSTIM